MRWSWHFVHNTQGAPPANENLPVLKSEWISNRWKINGTFTLTYNEYRCSPMFLLFFPEVSVTEFLLVAFHSNLFLRWHIYQQPHSNPSPNLGSHCWTTMYCKQCNQNRNALKKLLTRIQCRTRVPLSHWCFFGGIRDLATTIGTTESNPISRAQTGR